MCVRQIRSIPQLFGKHATLICKIFYGSDERHRIAAGCQFVMAAFSSQDRPAPPNSCSIESTTIVFLSIAIAIVTAPARALWQIMSDDLVDNFD
jgi:hypothetical protein